MRYLTSDTHLAHPFVAALRGYVRPEYAEHSPRELQSMAANGDIDLNQAVNVDKHDERIITMMNDTMTKHDEIYILGDLSSGSRRSMEKAVELVSHLHVPRSNRHLILGNHDNLTRNHSSMNLLLEQFADVSMNGFITIDGRNLLMSHFQFRRHFEDDAHDDRLSTNYDAMRYARYAPVDDGHTLLLHGHTHAVEPFEFNDPSEVNIGYDAWRRLVSEEDIVSLMDDGRLRIK